MEIELKRILSLISIIIGLFTVLLSIEGCAINPSPKVNLETAGTVITEARQSIANARDEKAPEYAPKEFADAESLLQQSQDMLMKKRGESAMELAFFADVEAKIALSMAREANAKYRIQKAKDDKMEVYWEAKSNEVAIAKTRQAIAEKVAYDAQTNSEISSETADMRVQKAEVQLAIAKAEVEMKMASLLNAQKYAEQAYNDADASLKEALAALADEDFEKATAAAENSAKYASNAQVQAKAKSEAENAETMRKKDKAVTAIAKAEVALDEAKALMADQYAKELYDKAEKSMKDARNSFDSADYDSARTLAEQTRVSASSASAVIQTRNKEEKTKETLEEVKAYALDAVAKAERIMAQASNVGANDLATDLYSQAQTSLEKAKQAMEGNDYEKAVSIAQESIFNASLAIAKAELKTEQKKKASDDEKNILDDAKKIPDITVRETEKGIAASISIDIFTKTGDIKSELKPKLKEIADFLKKYPNYRIIIEGHTDNTGKENSNMKLSSDRASAVLIYMANVEGVPLDRLSSVGYGSLRPLAPNTDEAGRKQNRRIDILILNR
jgi:outer membrane protein OmpA-like peptidoglycan-associated protein